MSKLSSQNDGLVQSPSGPGSTAQRMRRAGGSVHVSVAGEIGQRIVRGDYPPGTILPNEAKWAETFKVSRSAVREAVKMLTAKSLLASRPKIGSRVEPRSRWNLLDRDVLGWYASAPDQRVFLRMAQELRHLIEPEAAAFAALRRSDRDLADIQRFKMQMEEAQTSQDWMEANIRFHLAVLAASGNDLLIPLGVIVESSLRHLVHIVSPTGFHLQETMAMHVALERAIRLQRPDAARRAMRQLLGQTDAVLARDLES